MADPLVRPLFEATFREHGLPQAIRTDNGPPFASLGAGGLSRLAVWWVRLGIRPERLPELAYPAAAVVRRALPNGEIRWRGRRVYISHALAGECVGVEEITDGHWRVRFGPIELGWLDARRPERLHPHNSAPILSPIIPV